MESKRPYRDADLNLDRPARQVVIIERISLTPGPERGEIYATLHGELGTILNWTERQAFGKSGQKTPAAMTPGVSESVVAGGLMA